MRIFRLQAPLALLLLPLLTIAAFQFRASSQSIPAKGTVEVIQISSDALKGNLIGDSPVREVSVYLPPGYAKQGTRRYPVVYFLHGFTDSDAKWFGRQKHWISLPEVLDKAFAAPGVRPMIVVMPNAFNAFHGSMYSSSATIGDWETFVARELVQEIDRRYRTVSRAAGRGLAGHSMGGYGALRIGMKNPDVFSSLYLMSPCCLAPNLNFETARRMYASAEAVQSLEAVAKADFRTKAALASAAAWSPNPKNPPLYLDLPVKNGEIQSAVLAKWAANAPLAMLDQFVFKLRAFRGLALEAGDKDEPIASTVRALDNALRQYDIPHEFEIYSGDHLNRIAERIETKLAPFFSQKLATQ